MVIDDHFIWHPTDGCTGMSRHAVLAIVTAGSMVEEHSSLLRELGFPLTLAATGAEGLGAAVTRRWSLVVIGFTLPDMAGYDILRVLRRDPRTATVPIVILGPNDDETDVVAALELGADDYLVEPTSPRVFASRVRSLVRQVAHIPADQTNAIEIQGIRINPGHRDVFVGSNRVALTATEFELLHFLASHPGHAFRREEILRQLRGNEHLTSRRAVDVQIAGLRRRLGAYGNRIETVRGIGYRLRSH